MSDQIVIAITSILIAGFVSWILAYEYWRKAQINKTQIASAHSTLELSAEQIWRAIISKEFENYLDWRGAYQSPPRLHEELSISNGLYNRTIYFQVINKPKELAWGGTPTEWDHKLTLQPLENGTRLNLQRIFWPYRANWYNYMLDGFKNPHGEANNPMLVKRDMDRLVLYIKNSNCHKADA